MKNFTVNQMCRMNGMLIESSSLGNDTAKRRQRDGIERQGHSSVGITKLLFAITLLFTIGVGQMWGEPTFSGGYAYFYNIGGWSDSYKQLCIGKSNYTETRTMTAITNTKLWYNSLPTSGWGDATYMAVIGNSGSWGSGSWETSNLTNANHRTGAVSLGNWGFSSGNVNMLTPANGNNDATLALSYVGNAYSSLNKTITIKAKVSTNNGSSYTETTTPAALDGASKVFTSYTSCAGTSGASATLSVGSSSTTFKAGYTATTTLTAPTTDPSGYKFDGWYNSSGTRQTTSKTLTIYPTEDATYYAYYRKLYTIAASSTVVWDLCGNEQSWSAVYLYRDIEGESATNDAFTQCGTTTQYKKTYASAVNNIKVWLFRAQNGNTWSDYKQTTDIYRDVSGVTLYEFDNTLDGKKLNWQVTTGAKKATSGTKVYFDNTNANWGEIWLKYGTSRFNRHTGATATKVNGTANLYVITMPEAYYVNWYFASSYGWTNRNNISDTHVGKRIPIQSTDLTSDITFVPTGSTSGSSPTQYAVESFTGHTRRLTFGSHTNGNITVRYTDESGVEQTVSSASADHVDVAQTCQVIITAVPNSGYAPSTLTLGGTGITSGATQTIRADGTIDATFVAEETHDVTVSYMYGDRQLHADATTEVGVTTAADISAEVIDGFQFSAWSDLTNVTNNTGNLTTNPISINTIVSGSDGSMTCNYTPWTCSLDLVASEGATGHSSRTAMSYDATAKAYYINRTTASATERYRFYINSIEYSTSGNTELTIDETKVIANTNVTNYASNKPSVYFNDGPSGSNITIWFDYETKKAWVTEQKHTVTVSAGSHGSVSPISVTAGAITASETITATADPGYYFTGWTGDINNGVTIASGSGTRIITVNATADSKTITANFAPIWRITCSSDSHNTENHQITNITIAAGVMTSGYVDITLDANTDYDFKVFNKSNNHWWGKTSTVTKITYANQATAVTLSDNTGNNQTFFTAGAGTYRFTWNTSNNQVTVTYPTSYTVTYYNKFRDIDGTITTATTGGSISGMSGSASGAQTSGKYFNNTETVTLTHTTANSGYNWIGWYNSEACSSAYSNGGNVAISDASRTIGLSNLSANAVVAALFEEIGTDITLANDGHGHVEINSATETSTTVGKTTSRTIVAVPTAGYHFNAWTATSGTDYTIGNTGSASTSLTGKGSGASSQTVTATFTANSYSVSFNANGGSGSMSNQAFTYDAEQDLTACSFSKTGYTFGGWAISPENAAAGTKAYDDEESVINLNSTNGAIVDLYAIWTAKSYIVELDIDEDNHGTIDGKDTEASVTYDAAPTTIAAAKLPTAANGYCFMGFFTATAGGGVQVIDADGTWISDVTGYMSSGNWVYDGEPTLYAYYKKAEITNIAFSPGTIVENNSTVTVTATVSPTPTGTTTICWRVLYDNGSALDPQPTFDPEEAQGNSVSFTAPEASGMYKVEAVLHIGSGCGGTGLDTEVADFQVAGSHTVTVAYKHSSTTIKASTSVTGRPLDWSDPITAPEIFGYTFDHWTAGDGITLSEDGSSDLGDDESDEETIYIKATYNGTLTANYTPKNIIYFKDNLEWTDPEDENAHIYVNLLTGDYWNTSNGSGNKSVTNRNLQMDRVPGTTDIFYYDYGNKTTSKYISFTRESMDGYENFYQTGTAHVVFPSRALDALGTDNANGLGFYAATPMFVPLATQTPVKKNDNHATYYNDGYWTKYLPGTGYTLEIYNAAGNSKLKEIEFSSADELMPMKVTTDLEGGHTYKFQLKRGNGDVYYGNNGTMTYADHGQNTAWDFYNNSPFNMCTIVTNAAGDYTFNLSYSPNSGGTNNRLRMEVDYPIADGDYRLIYSDATQTKPLTSAIVSKENNGSAIVSFFVRKYVEDVNTPVLRIQQASLDGSGNITWNEYPTSGTPTNQITGDIVSAIDATGVYNFNLSMNGSGALSVASAEPYTGNFYIRTDAANSKWDNYRTDPDHLMTYSEYSITHGGYSHYYTHWVNKDDVGRKNVKFVIANDYSPCISDTLARETASGTWANIATFMEEGGDLKRSANVRFMWNSATNEVSRAYIDGSQEDGSQFLLLLSDDSKIKQGGVTKTQVTFNDNGNWLYEANISALPNAQIKLKSTWGEGTTIDQYFKGASDATETLVGGSGEAEYNFRLIYDFKTNRLLASYVPATGTISTDIEINADVMFVREHQGDIEQLTFSGSGAISDIKTAYGVMRFNKWTINNKDKSTHDPLPLPQPSRFERDIFYVSFPFRVNLEEVFGFGTYGTHWIIEEYDGASRAEKGFWADSPSFWKFITNRKGKFLEPNKGYILALDLDELGESSSVWANTDQVELYFPSYGSMPDIKSSSVTYEIPAHTCNIGPRFEGGDDRRIKDSHWNVMSVPTYVNTDDVSFANTDWITAGDGQLGPNFLYTVNWNDNSLTATSGVGYTYHAMHAYMVQYCGNVTWTTSVSPAPAVGGAPRRNPNAPKDVEYRIELSQNDKMVDQTFVRLSNDEHVTTGFEFNYDLSKEFNKNKANIYTMVSTMIDGDLSITETAGNTLPMTEQTTVVPVGVIAKTTGDYTFAIPEGTNGVGVTLIDNETGIRTSLSALDYTVNLDAGTYNERFVLEISPVNSTPTSIENGEWQNGDGARKVLIDNHVYIIRGDKMYDATGALVNGK